MKVCRDCPFRRTSMRGWLGPFRGGEELAATALAEQPMSCHSRTDGKRTDFEDAKLPQCAGRLAFAAKMCKRFRDPDLYRLQKEAVRDNDEGDILGRRELVEHHGLNWTEEVGD